MATQIITAGLLNSVGNHLRMRTVVSLGDREVCVSTIYNPPASGESVMYDYETMVLASKDAKITNFGELYFTAHQDKSHALTGHDSIVHQLLSGEIQFDFN